MSRVQDATETTHNKNDKDEDPFEEPRRFGDIITLDNTGRKKERAKRDESRHADRTVCVWFKIATLVG